MKKLIFASVFITLLSLLTQVETLACSCPTVGDTSAESQTELALHASRAAFSGEVVEISPIPNTHNVLVKIKVKESWKETLPEEITVTTENRGCGYLFRTGASYLVFAGSRDDGSLTTGLCLRNKEIEKAAEELKILGKGTPPITGYAQTAETGDWSETVSGIQGRLITETLVNPALKGTKTVVVYLELRNVSNVLNPAEIYFDPNKSIDSRVIDMENKSFAPAGPVVASIMTPPPFLMVLPYDSKLRFRISVSGYGLAENSGTNIQMLTPKLTGFWLIKAADKSNYFLEAAFSSPPAELDSSKRMWKGTINLPKVLIPH